jgi:hypothetical protein
MVLCPPPVKDVRLTLLIAIPVRLLDSDKAVGLV